jgi:8-oxo-dGTP pyrophosphatase MutT (NUDIX family)
MLNKWSNFINETKGADNLAARVVCVGPNETILIMKRSDGSYTSPGKWDIPGGHVDRGDNSFEEAAIRELFEETCLNFDEEDLVYLGRHDWQRDIVYYYGIFSSKDKVRLLANPDSGFIEHTDYKWATIDQIKEYEKQELTTFPIYLLRMALERVQK